MSWNKQVPMGTLYCLLYIYHANSWEERIWCETSAFVPDGNPLNGFVSDKIRNYLDIIFIDTIFWP